MPYYRLIVLLLFIGTCQLSIAQVVQDRMVAMAGGTGNGILLTEPFDRATYADFSIALDSSFLVKNPPGPLRVSYLGSGCDVTFRDIIGQYALIDRGDCSFIAKVEHAQNQGAAAVIICNNDPQKPDDVVKMSSYREVEPTVPAFFVSDYFCGEIKRLIDDEKAGLPKAFLTIAPQPRFNPYEAKLETDYNPEFDRPPTNFNDSTDFAPERILSDTFLSDSVPVQTLDSTFSAFLDSVELISPLPPDDNEPDTLTGQAADVQKDILLVNELIVENNGKTTLKITNLQPAEHNPDTVMRITGNLSLVVDGYKIGQGFANFNNRKYTACDDIVNTDLKGMIALIDRGECSFEDKIINVGAKGAIAAIICNNDFLHPEKTIRIGSRSGEPLIPTVSVSYNNCEKIKTALAKYPNLEGEMLIKRISKEIGNNLDSIVYDEQGVINFDNKITGTSSSDNITVSEVEKDDEKIAPAVPKNNLPAFFRELESLGFTIEKINEDFLDSAKYARALAEYEQIKEVRPYQFSEYNRNKKRLLKTYGEILRKMNKSNTNEQLNQLLEDFRPIENFIRTTEINKLIDGLHFEYLLYLMAGTDFFFKQYILKAENPDSGTLSDFRHIIDDFNQFITYYGEWGFGFNYDAQYYNSLATTDTRFVFDEYILDDPISEIDERKYLLIVDSEEGNKVVSIARGFRKKKNRKGNVEFEEWYENTAPSYRFLPTQ